MKNNTLKRTAEIFFTALKKNLPDSFEFTYYLAYITLAMAAETLIQFNLVLSKLYRSHFSFPLHTHFSERDISST